MYRLYIDEVGHSAIGHCSDLNERYLNLTGVIFDLNYVSMTAFPMIEDLKRRYFNSHPDNPIILHRKELVNKTYPFKCLMSTDIEIAFNAELLNMLEILNYRAITVTMDKLEYQQRYKFWQFEPYHYCLTAMIERYISWLLTTNAVGDVMAESRGGNEDRRLKACFEGIYKDGTNFITSEIFQAQLTSGQIKVKPKSNNIAGLQIADIIAHPSHKAILAYREQQPLPQNFGGKILKNSKYVSHEGEIEGFGRNWLP